MRNDLFVWDEKGDVNNLCKTANACNVCSIKFHPFCPLQEVCGFVNIKAMDASTSTLAPLVEKTTVKSQCYKKADSQTAVFWDSQHEPFGFSILVLVFSWQFPGFSGQIHRSWDDPKIGETLRIWALHRMLVPCQPVHLLVWPASRFIWPLRDLMMPWQPAPMLFEREKKVENWRTEELSVTSSKLFKFEHVQRREVMQKFQIQKQIVAIDCNRSQDEIWLPGFNCIQIESNIYKIRLYSYTVFCRQTVEERATQRKMIVLVSTHWAFQFELLQHPFRCSFFYHQSSAVACCHFPKAPCAESLPQPPRAWSAVPREQHATWRWSHLWMAHASSDLALRALNWIVVPCFCCFFQPPRLAVCFTCPRADISHSHISSMTLTSPLVFYAEELVLDGGWWQCDDTAAYWINRIFLHGRCRRWCQHHGLLLSGPNSYRISLIRLNKRSKFGSSSPVDILNASQCTLTAWSFQYFW